MRAPDLVNYQELAIYMGGYAVSAVLGSLIRSRERLDLILCAAGFGALFGFAFWIFVRHG